jgi:predicted lipid carrier protein YhbT
VEEQKAEKTLSVKLPESVVRSARIVSSLTGEPIQEILAGILRPALQKREEEAMRRRWEGQKKPHPAKKAKAPKTEEVGA